MENKPEIPALAARIKEFPIKIKKTKPFKNAQVCTGGVSLTEVHPHTLESRKVPGLYLAGELLDTDGICGGYTCSGPGPVQPWQAHMPLYNRKVDNMTHHTTIKLPVSHTENELEKKIIKTLKIKKKSFFIWHHAAQY